MADKSVIVIIEAQLQRDRGLLAALRAGTIPEAELQNSGYGTEEQISALERKIAENEKRLKIYEG